ncbi:MAG: replicative DNA helicase [Desulfovibrio sp.]
MQQKNSPQKPKSGSFRRSPEEAQRASSDLLRKTPPHNLEAEQAVLGGVFQSDKTFSSLVDLLTEDDFYSPAHKIVYRAFVDLYNTNTPIDLLTVSDNLDKSGQLDGIGGPVYLAELAEAVISSANALYHAKIVRDKSVQRGLINAASDIIADCYEAADTDALLDQAEQKIFQISDSRSTATFVDSKTLLDRVFVELGTRCNQEGEVTGIPTDYYDFDRMTAGLQGSDLIIIAGRPSMGKTAFALNLAIRASIIGGACTAVFSLEMSMEQLMSRMLGLYGRVNLSRLRSGTLDSQDWDKLYEAAQDISEAPIFIDDTAALSTLELRSRCRRLKAEHNLGLVVVDYLQLMRSSRKIDSREQEISDISRTLKAIAKELNVPVIALSQLNRKVEERSDKRPMMSDLRESGAIEQDADMIIFLYREDAYNKDKNLPLTHKAEIIIGKQRNGAVGTVELTYINEFTEFQNLSNMPEPSEMNHG